ncbi:MAG: CDP-alcohol phosphatidyltransferase family protein [Actinomycetota bacterium]
MSGGAAAHGAKKRDYWWTVLAVDPVALPLVRLFAKRRWLTPDQVSFISLLVGLAVGPVFATATRAGLIAGAVLFYLSFMLDCVDGKLARATGVSSPKGELLDRIGDGARRASAGIGLSFYLWRSADDGNWLWAAAFAILAAYFMEISGSPERGEPRGAIAQALARRRLLPNPGMPDVSALVYVIGPLTSWVVPALWVGIVLVVTGIARVLLKAATA